MKEKVIKILASIALVLLAIMAILGFLAQTTLGSILGAVCVIGLYVMYIRYQQ